MSNIMVEIKKTVVNKWYGCFVALAALLLTIVQIIVYPLVPEALFHPGVVVSAVFGVVLFVGLSLFKKTSGLAPIALMTCNFLAILLFACAEGAVDEFSTLFYDGFSLGKIFTLPAPVWLSILCFVSAFVISSVAVYLPQNKKLDSEKEEK